MRAVMPVRKALGVRTIFNILGPLLNPAGARRQVMGVYSARLVPVVAEAMTLLGTPHAFVVHGDGGMDELSLSAASEAAEVAGRSIHQFTVTPEAVGLTRAPISALAGGNAKENAAILTAIFNGQPGPHRDVVLLNAGAVLVAAGIATDLREGVNIAATAIDSGAVTKLIENLRA